MVLVGAEFAAGGMPVGTVHAVSVGMLFLGSCDVFVGWFGFRVVFGPAYVAGAPRSAATLPALRHARVRRHLT